MSGEHNPLGSPHECEAARALITPALCEEAREVLRNVWDFHPRSTLPPGYMLLSLEDGIWIAEDGYDLHQVRRYAKVIDVPVGPRLPASMGFLQALRLAEWVNGHPPAVAAPKPWGVGWGVAIRVPFFNDRTNAEGFDRHVVASASEARGVLGY